MKKLTYLFLIIGIMNSCSSEITKTDKIIIKRAILVNYDYGKYNYKISTSKWASDILIWSDSLYSIGDTLKLVKQ